MKVLRNTNITNTLQSQELVSTIPVKYEFRWKQDLFTHPSESYLVFEGKLVKNDEALSTDADVITLPTML